jgi:hypothetical protein
MSHLAGRGVGGTGSKTALQAAHRPARGYLTVTLTNDLDGTVYA